jgi:O-antigen/teichoic acid export membrane protein
VAAWYFMHGNHPLAAAFVWIAIFLPLGNAYNTWMAYTGGKKMFRIGSYYGFFNNIAGYVPVILAIYFARNFIWIVFANYFFVFLSSFVIYRHILRHIPPNEALDNETIPYGTHLSLMNILGTAAGQLDSLLVFHFIGAAELAVYSFATVIPERLAGMLKFIPGIALMKIAERSEEQVRRDIGKKLWVLVGIASAAAACYAILAPWFFHLFFPAYSASIAMTQLYALSFFSLAPTYVQTALTAQRKTKQLYMLNSTAPFVKAALMIVLMFYYGIWGLIWAQIINNFAVLGFQLIVLWRKPRAPATTVAPLP